MSRDIEPLVSCQWLKTEIERGLPNGVVVCDVSWSSTTDMKTQYNSCHITGAVHVNVMDESEFTEMYPRNSPKLVSFQQAVRDAGINNEDHVILYSNSDANGFLVSGRAWWTFKVFGHQNVSILNGGLKKWTDEGFPTNDNPPIPKLGNFTATLIERHITKYEDADKIVKLDSVQVCDSRAPSKYSGPSCSGHIVKAKNVPLASLMKDGILKSPSEIKEDFANAAVDITKPIMTYCSSGMSSCSLAFVADMIGCPEAVVYLGGFTEWSKKSTPNLIENTD